MLMRLLRGLRNLFGAETQLNEYDLDLLLQGPLLSGPRDASCRPGVYAFFERESEVCAHVGIASNIRKRMRMHYSRSRGEVSRFRDMVAQHLVGNPLDRSRTRDAARTAHRVILDKYGYRVMYTDSEVHAQQLEDRAKMHAGGSKPSCGWPYLDDPVRRPYVSGKPRSVYFEAARVRLGLAGGEHGQK